MASHNNALIILLLLQLCIQQRDLLSQASINGHRGPSRTSHSLALAANNFSVVSKQNLGLCASPIISDKQGVPASLNNSDE